MNDEKPLLNLEDFECHPEENLAKEIAKRYSFDYNITWERIDTIYDKFKQWLIKNGHLEELDRIINHYNSYFKDDKTPMNKINSFAYLRGSLDYWYEDKKWLTESEYKAFMLSLC